MDTIAFDNNSFAEMCLEEVYIYEGGVWYKVLANVAGSTIIAVSGAVGVAAGLGASVVGTPVVGVAAGIGATAGMVSAGAALLDYGSSK